MYRLVAQVALTILLYFYWQVVNALIYLAVYTATFVETFFSILLGV